MNVETVAVWESVENGKKGFRTEKPTTHPYISATENAKAPSRRTSKNPAGTGVSGYAANPVVT
jgi:hypothetical protein